LGTLPLSPSQRNLSVQGGARVQFHALREEVVACLALVEALIDFGEGEDLEEGVFAEGNVHVCFLALPCLALPGGVHRPLAYTRCTARERAQRLRDKIQSILSDNRRGEIVRAGIRLAIFGPPNVGKSSLLNFLGTKLPS
jgi:tRNA modification GTPase